MSDLILKQEEVSGKLEIYTNVESDKSVSKLYDVNSTTISSVALNETPQLAVKTDYIIPSNSSFSYPYNMQCDSLW